MRVCQGYAVVGEFYAQIADDVFSFCDTLALGIYHIRVPQASRNAILPTSTVHPSCVKGESSLPCYHFCPCSALSAIARPPLHSLRSLCLAYTEMCFHAA